MAEEYFDLGVIIPLEEEYEQFMRLFEPVEERLHGEHMMVIVRSGDSDLKILVALQDAMGKASAARTASKMLANYDIGLIVCLGIAAGLSTDFKVGDVVYTGTIIDVNENNKITNASKDDASAGVKIHFSPNYFPTPRLVTVALNYARVSPLFRSAYSEWQDASLTQTKAAIPGEYVGRDGQPETFELPRTQNGGIVCGQVTKSDIYNSSLLDTDRKLLAIETESGGVFDEADAAGVPALTIRGISDYGDENKTKLEESTNNQARNVAARNAASFLALQLKNPQFLRILAERRDAARGRELGLFVNVAPSDDVPSLIAETDSLIDEKLRELSPQFRAKPKGYRLPIPRARLAQPKDGLGASERAPLEVKEALNTHDHLILHVPRTYPDQSLAWVLAGDLLTSSLSGRQAFPIVVDGRTIRPPKHGIAGAAYIDPARIPSSADVQPIFIFDDMPVGSKTRSDYLIEELKQYPEAKCVFISRGELNLALESEFVHRLGAQVFNVCNVSFIEIASFLEKNFQLPPSECEVLALRLRDTFTRFDLSAHPTYFAGLSSEALVALLQANRRSELLQIATVGFLSFVVATDKADVTLSRTTRAAFLRRLLVEMKVHKRSFTQEALIGFTKEMALRYDYDIDPLAFIAAFVDKGILHFENDTVRVSLPFIEAYLLAAELAREPELASSYYNWDTDDFDIESFDIYAELGPSPVLVNHIIERLEASVALLRTQVNEQNNILLTDEIRPAILENPRRMEELERRLRSAMEDVRANKLNSAEKQQMLDAADRVRESAARSSEAARNAEDSDEATANEDLQTTFRLWAIGAVLLGSAAEPLEGEVKRRLAKALVEATDIILDLWMRAFPKMDWERFKEEMMSEETLRYIFDLPEGESVSREERRFVSSAIDVLEFNILSEPLRKMMHHLCESAGSRVLAASLEKVNFDSVMERVLGNTWLADIDGDRGRRALLGAIHELPPTPFLRVWLCNHFISRVYWSQWQTVDKLALLEAAVESVRPLSIQIDKAGTKRLIQGKRKRPRKK